MTELQYNQIICCSSEKSLNTGLPGFGVRAKSAGLTPETAEEIYLKSGLRYALPVSEMATAETVRNNPDLSAIYPHIYDFQSVELSNGSTCYIVARVMYAGADYGFFAGDSNNNRVGANYIAHILVFDQLPPVGVVADLIQKNLFLPADTRCTFDNPGFKRILVGDNFELPVGTVEIDKPHDARLSAELLLAILQSYKNKLTNDSIQKIIVKTRTGEVEDYIVSLGILPEKIANGLFFNANVLDQASVPNNLRMIIVNEKDDCETLDDYHIVVDTRTATPVTRNIEQNFLFDKIKEAVDGGRYKEAFRVASLFMQLCDKPGASFEQAYKIMMFSASDDAVTIHDVQALDLDLAARTSFSEKAEARFWQNVRKALDDAFSFPCKMSEIRVALTILGKLLQIAPDRIGDIRDFGKNLSYILFDKPQIFCKIIEDNLDRLDVAVHLLKKAGAPLPAQQNFYEALADSHDKDVWQTMLLYYYGRTPDMHIVVDSVMTFTPPTSWTILAKLYPVDANFEAWLKFVDGKPEALPLVKDQIDAAFIDRLKSNPRSAVAALEKLSPQVLGALSAQLKRALAISRGEEVADPTEIDMEVVQKLGADQNYVYKLFENWLKSNAAKDQIAKFISSYSRSAAATATLLDAVWNHLPANQRDAALLWLTDNVKLSGHDMAEAKRKMKSEDAVRLLEKESGFLKKMMRRFLNKSSVFALVLLSTLLSACSSDEYEAPKAFYSPFRAEFSGALMNTKEIRSASYNGAGTLMNIYSTGFLPNGDLLYQTKYNSKGGIDSTLYSYTPDGQLMTVHGKDFTFSDIQYNSDNQLVKLAMSDPKTHELMEYWEWEYDNGVPSVMYRTDKDNNRFFRINYNYDSNYIPSIRTTIDLRVGPLPQRVETFDNMGDGRIVSEDFYDEKGNLTSKKNYSYTDNEFVDDYTFTYTVNITNEKGKKIGRNEITVVQYEYDACDEYFDCDEFGNEIEPSAARVDISSIPLPEEGSNFASNYFNKLKYRIAVNNATSSSPNNGLLWAVGIIGLLCGIGLWFLFLNFGWFRSITGSSSKLKKLWMFKSTPYIEACVYTLLIVLAFLAAILILMIFGGVVYGVLWIVKLLIIILVIVGWIALIGGALALFFGKDPVGCLPLVLGGLIVYWGDGMKAWATSLVDWGFEFMNKLALYTWTKNLFANYWDVMLLVFLTPIAVFASIAFLIILMVFLLQGFEWVVMKIYGINRPCPVCGSKDEKEYYADRMHKHPVRLRPGVYGVFSHTEPETGERMPTMLLNGKGRLLRKCPNCGNFINSDEEHAYGTERHIGFVGNRSSGKSYLTYSVLDDILTEYGSEARQIDAARDTDIKANVARVKRDDGIQTDVRDSYRAVQVVIQQKMRPVPYHLFFYDVAGEKFNQKSSASKTAMDFYRNVNEIVFIIDPTTLDLAHAMCSDKMEEWLKTHASSEHYSIDGTFSTLRSILESVGRNPRTINFMFVLAKADMGYIEHCGFRPDMDEETIKRFIQSQLGLSNIVNAAGGTFKKVEFAVASVKPSFAAQLKALTNRLLKNVGI